MNLEQEKSTNNFERSPSSDSEVFVLAPNKTEIPKVAQSETAAAEISELIIEQPTVEVPKETPANPNLGSQLSLIAELESKYEGRTKRQEDIIGEQRKSIRTLSIVTIIVSLSLIALTILSSLSK